MLSIAIIEEIIITFCEEDNYDAVSDLLKYVKSSECAEKLIKLLASKNNWDLCKKAIEAFGIDECKITTKEDSQPSMRDIQVVWFIPEEVPYCPLTYEEDGFCLHITHVYGNKINLSHLDSDKIVVVNVRVHGNFLAELMKDYFKRSLKYPIVVDNSSMCDSRVPHNEIFIHEYSRDEVFNRIVEIFKGSIPFQKKHKKVTLQK